MTCLGFEPKSLDSKTSHHSSTPVACQVLRPGRADVSASFLCERSPELGRDSAPPPVLELPVFFLLSLRTPTKVGLPFTSRGSTRSLASVGRERNRKGSLQPNFGNHLGRSCCWCLSLFNSLVRSFVHSTDVCAEAAECRALFRVLGYSGERDSKGLLGRSVHPRVRRDEPVSEEHSAGLGRKWEGAVTERSWQEAGARSAWIRC
uniref:Uncharacterized protein n=1 Tax=Molossus molossus TaxID=27622 RepID=A0A7J8F9C9_MOLMO|nr:hypothetical protein HJG59_008570 [Molossus molossus]